ncbi:MAG TPA: hypothetical protein VLB84_12750 [Bacteroidia bacterium]|nr:hypothetical protein [Bacteroidia bacterium]
MMKHWDHENNKKSTKDSFKMTQLERERIKLKVLFYKGINEGSLSQEDHGDLELAIPDSDLQKHPRSGRN